MPNYYFIGTFIPELQIGMQPEITVEAYAFLLKENLTALDYEEVKKLTHFFDLENIRSFWNGQSINNFGNFNEVTLEEALLNGMGLSDNVYNYMDRHESKEERIRNFAEIYADFFNENSSEFLKEIFKQEKAIQLVLVALRAKKKGRSILHELQYENPEDDLVAQILAQKDAKSFDPPNEFLELKTLYEKYSNSPLELHQALVTYRYRKLEEMIGLQVFTLDRLLVYYFQLVLAYQWMGLDKEKGKRLINTIVQGIS